MIGRDPALVVTPEDDAYHPPTTDDPSWVETMWFPFWRPEEAISGSVRLWFSENAGQQGGAVAGWRGASEGLFGDRWSEPFTTPPDLRDLQLSNGLQIECLAPLSRYRIRHETGRLTLDLIFESIMPPNPVAPEESPGMFAGHLEQPGRIAGRIAFDSVSLEIDCHSIRDRSWGPRSMPEELRLGNAYGTAEGFAFFSYVNPTSDGTDAITSGYLLCDGMAAKIVSGVRETRLRDGMPVSVRLAVEDAADRRFEAEGECMNAMASNAGNGVYAVLNLVRWEHDGGVCWGENHDVWSERAWLAAGRPKL